jgi:hypothetical protein
MILCQDTGERGGAVGWGTALQAGRSLMNQTGRKEKEEKTLLLLLLLLFCDTQHLTFG